MADSETTLASQVVSLSTRVAKEFNTVRSEVTGAVNTAKAEVKNELLGGAGEAYDTLKELATLIDTNKDAIGALQTIANGHVKFDGAQKLTEGQKTQARTNIDAVSSAQLATKLNGTVAKVGEALGGGTATAAVSLDTLTDEGEFFVAKAGGLPAGVGSGYQNLMVSVRKSGSTLEQTVRGIEGGHGRVFVRHGTAATGGDPAGRVAWDAFAEVGATVDLSGYATKEALAATDTKAQKGVADAKTANDAVAALAAKVGDTTVDLVRTFEAALTKASA